MDLLESDGKKYLKPPSLALDPLAQDAVVTINDLPRRWAVSLATAYRASGREEEALEIIGHPSFARLDSVVEFRENALNRDYLVEAEVRMIEGDTNGALDMLEAAVDANLYFNWQLRVERNSAFSDLRSDPRYVSLRDRIREKIRTERLNVTNSLTASVQTSR